MKNIDYKKAGSFYLIGSLFNKGISFLTVPIFTRLLSTSDYGIVTTYNSWVTILAMVMGCAIYMGIRASFIDYKDKADDFLAVCTTFTLAFAAIIFIVVGVIASFLVTNTMLVMIVLCMFQGTASALIQNYSMYLMMQYRYKARTAFMILPNLTAAVLSILIICFVMDSNLYMGRIVPSALVYTGFGLLIILLVYRKSRMLFNKEYLKYALAISLPLVLHGIALDILSQSDRTMITWLADSSQTGIYSLVYNFGMIATVITTSLDGIWVPWFTERLTERKTQEINRLAVDYINLMTYAMIAVILIGPEVVKFLASESYWDGIKIIPMIVLANYIIFAYTLYVNIEHFHKKTLYITINTVTAAVINLVLNFILIPYFGYIAAAFTTVVSYFIAFVLHARYAKKLEPDLYPIKTFVRPSLHLLASLIVFYVWMDSFVVRWVIMAVYILAMFYRERKRIMEFMPSLKTKFKK